MQQFIFNAVIYNVVDGDTVDALIDLGFGIYTKQRLRLLGINASELNSKDASEREKATKAKDYLISEVLGKDVIIHSKSKDKYGRYLADIYVNDLNINDLLINKGLAEVYKRESVL